MNWNQLLKLGFYGYKIYGEKFQSQPPSTGLWQARAYHLLQQKFSKNLERISSQLQYVFKPQKHTSITKFITLH
jgi:hypothetical protein